LATGTNDDGTVRANREGFDKFALRVRRLVDVSNIDTSIELMGTQWETPIVIAPTGSQKAFHPEGEVAVARAARAKGHLQILSTVTTSSVEEVTEARGAPIWYQLYPTTEWSITTHLLSRAEAAGCPVVALTVDLQGGSNRETAERARRNDERQCDVCHAEGGYYDRKSMFDGVDTSRITSQEPLTMTWDYAKKIQDTTTMKLYIKGIVTAEDAALCVDNGIDGIVVSNHGGRAEASNRSTIECLPEIVAAVRGRIPVIIDGGFRRGTDIFKALALGANAIAIGRPYLWGLGAFGQPGVETVLSILRAELEMVMRQAGTTSIRAITKDYVV
jgi:isopentenyl diphosphate isomerase/L-lactate dehydrogenase-like FMN-dependent dehydrogenase